MTDSLEDRVSDLEDALLELAGALRLIAMDGTLRGGTSSAIIDKVYNAASLTNKPFPWMAP